jgi:hypothetical protein
MVILDGKIRFPIMQIIAVIAALIPSQVESL